MIKIKLNRKSFMGGVKVPENKFAQAERIEEFPAPEKAILPLSQHIGAPCEPVV
ncbi:electron transport complex subunit RsxC, partial [Candidatus Aerophobetes bacterium]